MDWQEGRIAPRTIEKLYDGLMPCLRDATPARNLTAAMITSPANYPSHPLKQSLRNQRRPVQNRPLCCVTPPPAQHALGGERPPGTSSHAESSLWRALWLGGLLGDCSFVGCFYAQILRQCGTELGICRVGKSN